MSGPHHLVAAASLFVLGAVVGSFVNVCAHRIPLGLSVLRPASRCPGCGATVAARDNVPILGWLLLRGRCRGCGGAIAPRYPIVEAAVGLLLAAPVLLGPLAGRGDPLEAGPGRLAWRLAVALALSGFLVTGALIAADHGAVPRRVAWPGLAAAALLAATRPPADGGAMLDGPRDALVGLAVAVAAATLAGRARRRCSADDLAFAAMVGALVGGRAIAPVLAIAAAIALAAPALAARRRPGRAPLPPGVALGLAGLVAMVAGLGPG